MNRNQASGIAACGLAGLLTLAIALPAPAQQPKPDPGHDFIFLAESRPILVRVHVRVDGKSLQEAHTDFMMHLFRQLDVKGKGFLTLAECERAPLAEHVKSGNIGSVLGFYGGPVKPSAVTLADYAAKNAKDGKLTWTDLAGYYHSHGLVPFQVQPEITTNAGGMMSFLGDSGPTEPTVDAVSSAVFALLDSKKTGKLTKAQLAAAPDVLLKLDSNEDEMITVGELVSPTPRKAGAGMMQMDGFSGGGLLMPASDTPNKSRVIVVSAPGEVPGDLAARLQERYFRYEQKLDRKALELDEAGFKALDANGDGLLDVKELAGIVKRPPDLEFTVHLGDAKGVEPVGKKNFFGDKLRTFDGLAMLDLRSTRVEFRGDESAATDPLAPFTRLQYAVLFKQADKANRGYITQQDANMFASAFKAMDKDGDGKVTEQEFLAYLEFLADLHERSKKACVSLVLTDESRGLFDLLDVNRDGRLSVREMRAAPGLLARYDRDNKGFLTAKDFPRSYRVTLRHGPATGGMDDFAAILTRIYGAGSKAETFREPTKGPLWFRKMDKNRDGDISRKEWLGSEEVFREIDSDGDGLISPEEADRFDAKTRKR